MGTIGDAREQTCVHDLVYGLHRIFDVALTILHARMQGVEHVNKQMKLILVAQCTAANHGRRDKKGNLLLGDVAQAATAIVSRQHIINGPIAASLPADQYSKRLQGQLGWGTEASKARVAKAERSTRFSV